MPQRRTATLRRMDERVLAERLITYDTSTVEGLRAAAGFIKGWLEARDIAVADHQFGDVFAPDGRGRPAGRPDARLPRPLRRRPGAAGAVHAAHPGRPARGPRRL